MTGGIVSGLTEPFSETEFSQFPIAPRDQCGGGAGKEEDPINWKRLCERKHGASKSGDSKNAIIDDVPPSAASRVSLSV